MMTTTSRVLRISIVAGVVVAVVAGAVVWVLADDPGRWESVAQLVVLPAEELGPDVASSYYETLSRGQIVGTFAELMPTEDDVDVSVVPDTAVIAVRATGSSPAEAEQMAADTIAAGFMAVDGLDTPYRLLLARAPDAAVPTGLASWQVLAAVLAVALVMGAAAQQAALYLGTGGSVGDRTRSAGDDRDLASSTAGGRG